MITAINGSLIALMLLLVGLRYDDKRLALMAVGIASAAWLVNAADENGLSYPRIVPVLAIIAFTVFALARAALILF